MYDMLLALAFCVTAASAGSAQESQRRLHFATVRHNRFRFRRESAQSTVAQYKAETALMGRAKSRAEWLQEIVRGDWIRTELRFIQQDPVVGWGSMEPLSSRDDAPWSTTMTAPDDSPYAGHTFAVTIIFPKEYLKEPPKVAFMEEIYHCNRIVT